MQSSVSKSNSEYYTVSLSVNISGYGCIMLYDALGYVVLRCSKSVSVFDSFQLFQVYSLTVSCIYSVPGFILVVIKRAL